MADELDKIIADLSVMNADMTDEEHADAMASLLLLRDEARYVLSNASNYFTFAQEFNVRLVKCYLRQYRACAVMYIKG